MSASDWSESRVLAEFVEHQCEHLDLVASWDMLLVIYSELGFFGPTTDEDRLAEFKTVITETNKFLTRMRNGLISARSIEDAIVYLGKHIGTADMGAVKTRESVAYNRQKQQWIAGAINYLEGVQKLIEIPEGESDE